MFSFTFQIIKLPLFDFLSTFYVDGPSRITITCHEAQIFLCPSKINSSLVFLNHLLRQQIKPGKEFETQEVDKKIIIVPRHFKPKTYLILFYFSLDLNTDALARTNIKINMEKFLEVSLWLVILLHAFCIVCLPFYTLQALVPKMNDCQ